MTGPGPRIAIVGAGPVGLVAAIELARRGLRPIVLDAKTEIQWSSRAICISRRSLEIFRRIGMAEGFFEKALPWTRGKTFHRDRLVFELEMPHGPGDRYAPFVNIQQNYTERYLLETLQRIEGGYELRWGHGVTGMRQNADGVALDVASPDGAYTLKCDWVVAADGARSVVRQALGLQLKGASYEGRYLIADIVVEDAAWPVERHVWFDPPNNPGSTAILHVQPDNVWRIDLQLRDGEDGEAALDDVNLLPRLQSQLDMMGVAAPWRLIWKSLYRAHALTLDAYRHGRVLLAGDAAHLVPIFGVRGLNSGIDDAHNLAWKLASVATGQAPAALLDSYSVERRGATLENLANATKSTWFMSPPTEGFRTMRDAVLHLAEEHGWARGLINPRQSSAHVYRSSPVIAADAEGEGEGVPPGASLPDLPVRFADRPDDPAHLLDALPAEGFSLLLFPEGRAAGPLVAAARALGITPIIVGGTEEGTSTHILDGDGRLRVAFAVDAFPAYLIRPDEHIAARLPSLDAEALEAAFRTAQGESDVVGVTETADPVVPHTPLEAAFEALSLALDAAAQRKDGIFLPRLALTLLHAVVQADENADIIGIIADAGSDGEDRPAG